jgi:hypothetical protein
MRGQAAPISSARPRVQLHGGAAHYADAARFSFAPNRGGRCPSAGARRSWTISCTTRLAVVVVLAGCGSTSSGSPAAPLDAGAADAVEQAEASETPTRVRIMAANLTSGPSQAYEQPGIDIFEGLAPDVVLIQEFNYAAGDLRSLVDTAFGATFSFYVEPQTGGIPNGVVSRYPILDSGVWVDASVSDRAFVYARIDIPGAIDLWAVSVHLLTTGETQRGTEATQLRRPATSSPSRRRRARGIRRSLRRVPSRGGATY